MYSRTAGVLAPLGLRIVVLVDVVDVDIGRGSGAEVAAENDVVGGGSCDSALEMVKDISSTMTIARSQQV